MCCARCAVELFEKSAPGYFGVIYMDIMMPRMNGWDAARTIRAMNRPDAEIIPIIAMSANAFPRILWTAVWRAWIFTWPNR